MGDQFGAKVRNEIERIQRMEGPSRCAHRLLRKNLRVSDLWCHLQLHVRPVLVRPLRCVILQSRGRPLRMLLLQGPVPISSHLADALSASALLQRGLWRRCRQGHHPTQYPSSIFTPTFFLRQTFGAAGRWRRSATVQMTMRTSAMRARPPGAAAGGSGLGFRVLAKASVSCVTRELGARSRVRCRGVTDVRSMS